MSKKIVFVSKYTTAYLVDLYQRQERPPEKNIYLKFLTSKNYWSKYISSCSVCLSILCHRKHWLFFFSFSFRFWKDFDGYILNLITQISWYKYQNFFLGISRHLFFQNSTVRYFKATYKSTIGTYFSIIVCIYKPWNFVEFFKKNKICAFN